MSPSLALSSGNRMIWYVVSPLTRHIHEKIEKLESPLNVAVSFFNFFNPNLFRTLRNLCQRANAKIRDKRKSWRDVGISDKVDFNYFILASCEEGNLLKKWSFFWINF